MKFGNKKTIVDGITFDSVDESKRWIELSLLEKSAHISELRRQVRIELIPSQYRNNKLVERAVSIVIDFSYVEGGETVYEEFKSPVTKTKDWIIKRKLLMFQHGIVLRVTQASRDRGAARHRTQRSGRSAAPFRRSKKLAALAG